MSAPKTAASVTEAEAFLGGHPEVRHISLILTDNCGVARGKLLTRDELLSAYKNGRYLPGSFRVLDVTGRDVEETGMVWEDGDADRLGWPVPGTLVPTPWAPGQDEAQFLTSLHELDGRPCIVDPRNTLSRIVENFSELGLTPVAAIELEFYLMDREAALSGRPKPPAAQLNGAVPKGMQPYLLQDLDDFGPFFDDVYKAGDIQGLPLQTLISEYSPGQMEIGLKHRADPLKACDEAIMYKRLVKAIAEKHGFVATFMAKPYKDLAGSGMHVHVSLVDKNGNNIFASEDPARNLPLRYAIGGLKATMAEAFAVFAPNANSYRRFRKNSYAPVAPTWGVNNRTVSLRIPAGSGQSVHIEHRVAGADANPYLVLAAVLAGMHHGMAAKIDPGPESKGNAYAAPAARMPTNWLDAIELWQRSATMRDYFHEELVDTFAIVKEAEADRFNAEPSPLDFEYYLRTI